MVGLIQFFDDLLLPVQAARQVDLVFVGLLTASLGHVDFHLVLVTVVEDGVFSLALDSWGRFR